MRSEDTTGPAGRRRTQFASSSCSSSSPEGLEPRDRPVVQLPDRHDLRRMRDANLTRGAPAMLHQPVHDPPYPGLVAPRKGGHELADPLTQPASQVRLPLRLGRPAEPERGARLERALGPPRDLPLPDRLCACDSVGTLSWGSCCEDETDLSGRIRTQLASSPSCSSSVSFSKVRLGAPRWPSRLRRVLHYVLQCLSSCGGEPNVIAVGGQRNERSSA